MDPLSCFVVALLLPMGFAAVPSPGPPNPGLSEFDFHAAPGIFDMRLVIGPNAEPALKTGLVHCSYVATMDEEKPFCRRQHELAQAALGLQETDADYARRWKAAAREAIDKTASCGLDCPMTRGLPMLWAIMVRHRIVQDIVRAAGSIRATRVTPLERRRQWGSPGQPFIRIDPSVFGPTRPSMAAFYYCAQANDFMVSGDPGNAFGEAHRRLMRGDPEYRVAFEAILRNYRQRAASSSRGLLDQVELTKEFRKALIEQGLDRRLEDAAKDVVGPASD